MSEDILKKLEQKVSRRSFLRGSSLAAAALVGAAAASPLVAFAQAQEKAQDKKPDDKKKDDKDGKKDTETKIDDNGQEYRECPQCGSNMYSQGRTWTCE